MTIFRTEQGITLVELLIATTLGMVIVLAITGLVLASKSAQSTQNDSVTIQDTARYALDTIRRSIKQAGYIHFDTTELPFVSSAMHLDMENFSPAVVGVDAHDLKTAHYSDTHYSDNLTDINAHRFSDVLALRYFGSGTPADDTVLNCAGFGVAAPTSQNAIEEDRGWSIYYVGNDADGEPALFCKYKGKTKFSTQAIVRGVEAFQVLYGIVNNNAQLNDIHFFNAQQINSLDSTLSESERPKKTHWKKITAIKVALLIRGAENSRIDPTENTYNLFGKQYSDHMGADDKGTQINERDIPAAQRKRLRKVVNATIQLRNALD